MAAVEPPLVMHFARTAVVAKMGAGSHFYSTPRAFELRLMVISVTVAVPMISTYQHRNENLLSDAERELAVSLTMAVKTDVILQSGIMVPVSVPIHGPFLLVLPKLA
jgi:hypothetical protein